MTVFGHAVLFDCSENSEDTAFPKTPMQWHITLTLSSDKALVALPGFAGKRSYVRGFLSICHQLKLPQQGHRRLVAPLRRLTSQFPTGTLLQRHPVPTKCGVIESIEETFQGRSFPHGEPRCTLRTFVASPSNGRRSNGNRES